jgi:hypothetical protein
MRSVLVLLVVILVAPALAGAELAKPKPHKGELPRSVVKATDHSPVANGCGSEFAQLASWSTKRLANKHEYTVEPERGVRLTYVVDFSDACDLHDVAYEGQFGVMAGGVFQLRHRVYDRILDEDVDVLTLSRAQADERFLRDMEAECDQQIAKEDPRGLTEALAACKGHGQPPKGIGPWGARTMYELVRCWANGSFQHPTKLRVNDPPPSRPRGQYGDLDEGCDAASPRK